MKLQMNKYTDLIQDITFKVYRRMEFNSDRKRMGIIIKDPIDNQYKLLIKGADSIIKSRLDEKQINEEIMKSTDDFLNKASLKGLRTLLMGMRLIDESEFNDF